MITLLDSNNTSKCPAEHTMVVSSDNEVKSFSFDSFPEKLEYSQPITLTMPNGSFQVKRWTEVLDLCYNYAFQNNQDKVESLADIETPFQKTILFSRHKEKMRHVTKLSSDFYAEKNFSAYSIAKIICGLMTYCGFPVRDFSITYRMKMPSKEPRKEFPTKVNHILGLGMNTVESYSPKRSEVLVNDLFSQEPERERDIELVDISAIEQDIRQNYMRGFDFSNNSKRLVEERTGQVFSNSIVQTLQKDMFERRDGIWFFENQIGDFSLKERIIDKCRQWLEKNPIITLNQFIAFLEGNTEHLENNLDKCQYAEFIIRKSDFGHKYSFQGKRGARICFLAELGADASKRSFATKIEALLRERLDSFPVSELIDIFPMVHAEWMIDNLPSLIPDAILEYLGDKVYAFKLLEFYYLPDDIAEVFQSTIEQLATEDEILSVSRILDELSNRYGYDFGETFALSEDVFKQIATRIDSEHRKWVGSIFGGIVDGGQELLSFKQIVEKKFPGFFSDEEFFPFAVTALGWREDHRGRHYKQLWNFFMRYDLNHWSSVDYFKKASGWNADIEKRISDALLSLLGTNPFFSLNKVPQQFLDKLPNLELEGIPLRWTLELLASITFFCLPRVRVLNHAAVPCMVSSLLVPSDVAADTDGISYMVRVFKLRNPRMPSGDLEDVPYLEMAVKFLLENDVRQKKSQKFKTEVAELLKKDY